LTQEADIMADRDILIHYGIKRPYIFVLGNIHPRKNLGRLLEAYLQLKNSRKSMPEIVWGGLERWESGALLSRARSAGVVLPGFIAQHHLATLYRQAEMLIYPSLYEGFGLPPLEAMACGTPVITSNTTSLPEVVGEAALVVDPTQVEEIAAAIARLLDDPTLQAQLRQAGIKRVRRFSWKRAAQELVEALTL
jgi:glycosyltransferase involved in cell wall biosynthesis